jgi:hypothetical protein
MGKKGTKPGAVELETISKKVTQRRKDAKQTDPIFHDFTAWHEILLSSYGVLR